MDVSLGTITPYDAVSYLSQLAENDVSLGKSTSYDDLPYPVSPDFDKACPYALIATPCPFGIACTMKKICEVSYFHDTYSILYTNSLQSTDKGGQGCTPACPKAHVKKTCISFAKKGICSRLQKENGACWFGHTEASRRLEWFCHRSKYHT